MAKCKYPNEVCANMTVLNGVTYCDSVPCSLKGEIPKQTNGDRIRNMTDEELAEFIMPNCFYCADVCEDFGSGCAYTCTHNGGEDYLLNWLKSEAKE